MLYCWEVCDLPLPSWILLPVDLECLVWLWYPPGRVSLRLRFDILLTRTREFKRQVHRASMSSGAVVDVRGTQDLQDFLEWLSSSRKAMRCNAMLRRMRMRA
jgi:hypothetical protein